jgi:hypothetical protein
VLRYRSSTRVDLGGGAVLEPCDHFITESVEVRAQQSLADSRVERFEREFGFHELSHTGFRTVRNVESRQHEVEELPGLGTENVLDLGLGQ